LLKTEFSKKKKLEPFLIHPASFCDYEDYPTVADELLPLMFSRKKAKNRINILLPFL